MLRNHIFTYCQAEMFRGEEASPALADILEMRANKNGAYNVFCGTLLAGAVSMNQRKWLRATATQPVSQVSNSVEEAFALLELENNWDVWEEIAQWLDDNPGKTEKDMEKHENQPKYTTKADQTGTAGGNIALVEGWQLAGHNRFAELHARVVEDRRSRVGMEFESQFQGIQREVETLNGGTPPTRRKRRADEMEVASTDINLLGELLAAVTPSPV